MRIPPLAGALGVSIAVGIAALGTPTAVASLGFLPGTKGTTFTATGDAEFKSNAGTLICKSSATTAAELQSTLEGTATIVLKECTVAGLEARGLGDAEKSKAITTKVKLKACEISASPLAAGVLVTYEPVHIEIPAAKLLLLLEKEVVGLIEPGNVKATAFDLVLSEIAGKQEIHVCGGSAHSLILKDDAKETGEDVEIYDGAVSFKVSEEWMV